MARFFIAACAVFLASSAYAQEFVRISKDKNSYLAGEAAQMRMRLVSLPESPGYEFFLKAKKGAIPVEVKKITETEFYSLLPSLTAGTHVFRVETYLQDKQLAAAFNAGIANYQSEIDRIDALLEEETDPGVIDDLEAEKAHNQSRIAELEAKLESIRRKVSGPKSISILVN